VKNRNGMVEGGRRRHVQAPRASRKAARYGAVGAARRGVHGGGVGGRSSMAVYRQVVTSGGVKRRSVEEEAESPKCLSH